MDPTDPPISETEATFPISSNVDKNSAPPQGDLGKDVGGGGADVVAEDGASRSGPQR